MPLPGNIRYIVRVGALIRLRNGVQEGDIDIHSFIHYTTYLPTIMEYGSTPYVGMARGKKWLPHMPCTKVYVQNSALDIVYDALSVAKLRRLIPGALEKQDAIIE